MSATFQFGSVPFGCNRLIATYWISLPPRARRASFTHSASSHSRLLVGICFRVSLCFIEFVLLPTPPAAFPSPAWLGLLFVGLSLVLRKRHPFADDFSPRFVFRRHAQIPCSKRWS